MLDRILSRPSERRRPSLGVLKEDTGHHGAERLTGELPAGSAAAPLFHEVHQAHGRPVLGVVMDATPTLVGPPVHEPWPGGKLP